MPVASHLFPASTLALAAGRRRNIMATVRRVLQTLRRALRPSGTSGEAERAHDDPCVAIPVP
jgi:hypothetical protein